MAGFNVSGGYAAGAGADALEDLLKRAFVEQVERRRAAQEDQRIAQEGERLKMAAADRAATMQDLAKSRAIQNAGRVAGALRIGQTVNPETVASLQAGDLGDLVQHDQADLPSRAISGIAQVGKAAPIMGALRIAQAGRPERDTFTGTAEQLAAEEARQDRIRAASEAVQARKDAAAQAAADRAAAAQAQRDFIASQNEASRQNARTIAGMSASVKTDAAQAKADEKKQAADTARQAALASIDDTSSALDELIDEKGQLKPGAAGAFGADSMLGFIPGSSYADAKARRERLQSRLTIDLLGEMKRQSRTGASGFGALSEKELAVLQSAAARLSAAQSDESARQALLDVRKQLAGMRQRAAGAAPAATQTSGGGGGFKVVEIK